MGGAGGGFCGQPAWRNWEGYEGYEGDPGRKQ